MRKLTTGITLSFHAHTLTGHFIRYTLLVQDWAFLILCGTESQTHLIPVVY